MRYPLGVLIEKVFGWDTFQRWVYFLIRTTKRIRKISPNAAERFAQFALDYL